eukprot:TRINITY_DN28739_c0_g1_i1.p1 TRINITY_DN28739_c0_g1~~TRINITY_DN28739_c0_g1_i1.p1  ORF type:complete len:184 (+),score=19.67 TRINITY_DN28739_c0_g1_i1:16-567(+)
MWSCASGPLQLLGCLPCHKTGSEQPQECALPAERPVSSSEERRMHEATEPEQPCIPPILEQAEREQNEATVPEQPCIPPVLDQPEREQDEGSLVAELRREVSALRVALDAAREATAGQATEHGSDRRDANDCIVCLSAPRVYAFTPCGHRCVCHMCAVNTVRVDRRCPICRVQVVRILKIIDP